VPVAIVQGADDHGPIRQIGNRQGRMLSGRRFDHHRCGHSPHREAPEATLICDRGIRKVRLQVHEGAQGRAA